MIPNVGPLEIGVLLLLAIVLFGPKRLPELGHGLGKGIREFRHGITAPSAESEPAQSAKEAK